jgi:hypothetical protein
LALLSVASAAVDSEAAEPVVVAFLFLAQMAISPPAHTDQIILVVAAVAAWVVVAEERVAVAIRAVRQTLCSWIRTATNSGISLARRCTTAAA